MIKKKNPSEANWKRNPFSVANSETISVMVGPEFSPAPLAFNVFLKMAGRAVDKQTWRWGEE